MIDATRRWLRRNRTSFAVGFGVLGVGYVTGQYVITKIMEARERMMSDRIAKEDLRRRFQQNQEDCTITVLELLPTVAENVLEALQTERISQEIQQKNAERLGRSTATSEIAPSEFSSGAPDEDGNSLSSASYVHASQVETSSSLGKGRKPAKTKAQLWNEVKITSITRVFTLVYTVSLLSLLTRIQLNLLGRRNYVSSVISQVSRTPQTSKISLEDRDDENSQQPYGTDFETNRNYLTFSWWLLHRGWKEIMLQVETAVNEVFGPLKVTESVGLERLSGLIIDVRKQIEGSSVQDRSTRKWLPYILPPEDQEAAVLRESGVSVSPLASSPPGSATGTEPIAAPSLRRLLDETADLIDSPMFTHVLTLVLDAIFFHITDQNIRTEVYGLSPLRNQPVARAEDVTEQDPANASSKLASICATFTKEAHKIGSGVPNEYVRELESVNDLEAFAAVIYSSKFQLERSTNKLASSPQNGMPTLSSDEVPGPRVYSSVVKNASLAVDAAWGAFGSVWGTVTG